ncbi:uncharacterized protein LOC133178184 [Saccostrea echinata]|uniref:uncharacterized protein LOC133178184 n=1 Tax=Saccostrea echinata TaxID=191078 RepID=UPI002A828EC1|nr:uncharacterized protein LOC133178184 [Saccostrea echinata]
MNAAHNLKCVHGLAEITELLLVLHQETPDLSINVQIKSSTEHHFDNLIFLIKLICSRHFCIETLFSSYGNYLQTFASLVVEMQSLENESHLSLSYSEDGTLTRRSYFLMSENDGYGLKCTKSKTKPNMKRTSGTVLHIRVFQSKGAMMLQAKKLYHYMKQISLCSKASFGLSLTVHENDCIFDIRQNMIEDLPEKGYSLSKDTVYILKDTQYVPSSLSPSIVSGNMEDLPNLLDEPDMTFQLYISGFKTVCYSETNTPSLVMLSWYGPGNIPLYDTGDAINPMKVLSLVKWTKYGIHPVAENSIQSKTHLQCHEFLPVRAIREQSCFVLSLYGFMDVKNLCSSERKMDAVFWLRKNSVKWMKIYEEKIKASLEFVIDKIVTPVRSADDEKTTLLYSQAISNISKSISNVVLRSSCEQFRRKCYQLLEVEEDGSVQVSLSKKLWNISESFGIFQPIETMESESCGPQRTVLDPASKSEFRNSETDPSGDNDFIQVHEDDLERLNWFPELREATATTTDILVSTTADSFEGAQMSKSMNKILRDQEASRAGRKPQVDVKDNNETNNNGAFEEDVKYPKQDLVKKVNFCSVQCSKENQSILQDENSISSMYAYLSPIQNEESPIQNEESPSQSDKYLYSQPENMNMEDHFHTVMEAEEEWNIAGVDDELRMCAYVEEQTLSNIPLGSDFRIVNSLQQQQHTPTETSGISEILEKESKNENLVDWLDEALLEMKNWFNDE